MGDPYELHVAENARFRVPSYKVLEPLSWGAELAKFLLDGG